MDPLKFIKENCSQKFVSDNCIYLIRAGSTSYGTNISSSDEDFKGICVADRKCYMGFRHRFEQYEHNDPDIVVYELTKWAGLLLNVNPNTIENLFVDPEDIIHIHPAFKKIIDIRESALSKNVFNSFSGYAYAQMIKLQNHMRWNKEEIKKPLPEDYGFILNPEFKNLFDTVKAEVQAEVDTSLFNDFQNNKAMTLRLHEEVTRLKLTKEEIWESHLKRFVSHEDIYQQILQYKKYYKDLDHYKKYEDWKKNRNPARSAQEKKVGYDCYSADTEFLTDSGWKLYDDIASEDKLATFFARRGCDAEDDMSHRPFLGIEHQNYVDRFDSLYNGPMYQVTAQCTDISVTSNHKMFFKKLERDSDKVGDWQFDDANNLPDTFAMLIAPNPWMKSYSNKAIFSGLEISETHFMSLMGWFLSDGCIVMSNDGNSVKSIRISQKPDGKLARQMIYFHKKYSKLGGVSIHTYDREPNEFNPFPHKEMVLDIYLKNVREKIFKDCGRTINKKIPRWAFGLSRSLMLKLLDGLLDGDGTVIEHKTKTDSHVYYSNSKKLADDVQELAFMIGYQTALWGPYVSTKELYNKTYTSEMYQVHIRPLTEEERSKKMIRSKNISKMEVKNHRVVCFSVPNGTLVTRRNGRIAMQGNCKNAYHTIRLSQMCKEILTEHKVIVKRKHDKDLYLDIRAGKYSYDELMEMSEKLREDCKAAYKTTTLPAQPNYEKFDNLVAEIVDEIAK